MRIGTTPIEDFIEAFLDPETFLGVICKTPDEMSQIFDICKERAGDFGIQFSASQKSGYEMWEDAVGGDVEVCEVGVDYYKLERLMFASPTFYIDDENGEGFNYILFDDIIWGREPIPVFDGLF